MNMKTFKAGLLAAFLLTCVRTGNVVAAAHPQERPDPTPLATGDQPVHGNQATHKHTNKLVGESSPYLLQHAHASKLFRLPLKT